MKDLLTSLPAMFSQSTDTRSALGPALQAAYKLMSSTGGRISVFQTQLPTLGAGALQSREDPNQRSSTKVTSGTHGGGCSSILDVSNEPGLSREFTTSAPPQTSIRNWPWTARVSRLASTFSCSALSTPTSRHCVRRFPSSAPLQLQTEL